MPVLPKNAEAHLSRRDVRTEDRESFVLYQPLGVVLAVMPWNFPFWQVFRFAAPALMAGNVGLLKHASNVPQCALAIEDVLRRAGAPDGVFQTLLIGSDAVGALIADPRVDAVTLTGSEGAGRDVAARAGREIKPSVLELGGSDPFIVMPSASLDDAVATAVRARAVNNGQSCIAAKRFIVHEQIFDSSRRVHRRDAIARGGRPLDERPRSVHCDGADSYRSRRSGAAHVARGARVCRVANASIDRETSTSRPCSWMFGGLAGWDRGALWTVAPLFPARDVADAIRIANSTTFGLGAAAWSNDAGEQTRFIDELRVDGGDQLHGRSDARLPFGGIKRSGYGRELSEEEFARS